MCVGVLLPTQGAGEGTVVRRGGVVVDVRSLTLFGFFGEPCATMSTIHKDPKVSHGGVVDVNRVGVVYVWLCLYLGIVANSMSRWVRRSDMGGNAFL